MGKKSKAKQRPPASPSRAVKPIWYAPLNHQPWTSRRQLIQAVAALLIVTLIAYLPTFQNDFTNWDDDLYVEDNRLVREFDVAGMFALDFGQAIGAVFDESKAETLDNTAFVAGNYHPLSILTLAVNYQMTGLDPISYQITNLLLHLLNTFLVFLLVLALTGKNPLIALITAGFFALHPMHVESVSWIAERKDVLYTAFFLGGLLTYWKHLEQPSWRLLGGAFLLFILSCLAKPAAVVFPLVMLLFHFWRGHSWNDVKTHANTLPFFAGAVFFGLLTLTAQIDSDAYGGLQAYSLFERLQIAGYGWLWYIGKFFLPIQQSAFYPYPPEIGGIFIVALLVAIGLAAWSIWQYRHNRWITFGVLFFTINLLLVLQFVSVGSAIVAERYTYIPYIGIGWIIGYVVHHILQGKWQKKSWQKPALYGTGALLLAFSILTFNRTSVWANTEVLFTDVVEKHPRAVVAWNNRGHYYRLMSDQVPAQERNYWLDKAFYDYNQALAVDPNYYLGYSNRGKVWFERQDFQRAIEDYTRAINIRDDRPVVWVNRGAAYASQGQLQQALDDFNQAYALDPDYAEVYFNRGIVYQQMQRFELALADFDTYLSYKPRATGIMNSRGVIYQSIGDHANAVTEFSEAIAIGYEDQATDLGAYFFNRAISYRVLQQLDAARNDVRQAEQLGYPVPANFKATIGL